MSCDALLHGDSDMHASGTVPGPMYWNASNWTCLVRSQAASCWHRRQIVVPVIIKYYNIIIKYNEMIQLYQLLFHNMKLI